MELTIRCATKEDVPSIAFLHYQFLQDRSFVQNRVPSICECSTLDIEPEEIEENILEEMSDPAYSHFVAMDQNKVIGYLVLISIDEMDDLLSPPYTNIDTIEIHQDYHQKGVGQALIEEAIRVAKEKNHHFIDLNVWALNEPALHLYSKNGFITIEQRMAKKLL
ncbi:GNAT family N-acetyltransferase [bacterium]|nr:GNAT family N-acetyltransferase [bacterium]